MRIAARHLAGRLSVVQNVTIVFDRNGVAEIPPNAPHVYNALIHQPGCYDPDKEKVAAQNELTAKKSYPLVDFGSLTKADLVRYAEENAIAIVKMAKKEEILTAVLAVVSPDTE